MHVSITHPSIDSPYPYFRGKALVERALADRFTAAWHACDIPALVSVLAEDCLLTMPP